MAKTYFQPVRMASQFVATDLFTIKLRNAADDDYVESFDGEIVSLAGFDVESVYTRAFGSNSYDINTRTAQVAADGASGVCVIDLAYIPVATNGDNVYRIGSRTIGLTQAADVPVRARMLRANDTFKTGIENCTAALTVNQFASVGADGKWAPEATAPATGTYCQVVNSFKVSEGVVASTDAYDLLVVKN